MDKRWWDEEDKERLKAQIKSNAERDYPAEGLPDGVTLAWLQDTGLWVLSLNRTIRDEEPEFKGRPILDVSTYYKPEERWIDTAYPTGIPDMTADCWNSQVKRLCNGLVINLLWGFC